MRLDHRASRSGSHHVLAWLAAAGACASPAGRDEHRVGQRRAGPCAEPRGAGGKIVGIDPGHNGLNYTDPAFLNHKIWNGREWEDCDTTGTATAGGYTEARF
jgi:N-acetylmuramoyl-L-alanine amidase